MILPVADADDPHHVIEVIYTGLKLAANGEESVEAELDEDEEDVFGHGFQMG